MNEQVIIPKALGEKVLNYLASRPYIEVAEMIIDLQTKSVKYEPAPKGAESNNENGKTDSAS